MAKRHATAGKGKEGYSDLRLIQGPTDFPDGDYVLHLDPIMLSVSKIRGEWFLGNELLQEHKFSQPVRPAVKA